MIKRIFVYSHKAKRYKIQNERDTEQTKRKKKKNFPIEKRKTQIKWIVFFFYLLRNEMEYFETNELNTSRM